MPNEVKVHLDVDDLIRQHVAGASIVSLAAANGCNPKTVHAAFQRAGFKPITHRDRLQQRFANAIDMPAVLAMHAQGVSMLQIAKHFGVTRAPIVKLLRKEGVHIRGQSEAETLKWQTIKATPGGVERQCAAAWEGARQPKPVESIIRGAVSHQRSVTRVGRNERELAQALKAHGVDTIPQRALHTYNLDLAVDADRVAVEVLCEGTSYAHAARHRKKAEDLIDRGWAVVWVLVTDAEQVDGCAQDVVALLDLFRREPSARGQDWVVRRDGKTAVPNGLKGEHRAPVLASRDRLHA